MVAAIHVPMKTGRIQCALLEALEKYYLSPGYVGRMSSENEVRLRFTPRSGSYWLSTWVSSAEMVPSGSNPSWLAPCQK
jgi:hypothetical protein